MTSKELQELQNITRILSLVYSESLEKELVKYASTDKRKMIWVLIDDINMAKDMVNIIGKDRIKEGAIQKFLNQLEKASLIENPKRKPPKKLLNFIPASWIKLLEMVTDEGESE